MNGLQIICSMLFLVLMIAPIESQERDQSLENEMRIKNLEAIIKNKAREIEKLEAKVDEIESQSGKNHPYLEKIVREYMTMPDAEESQSVCVGYGSQGFFIRNDDFELRLSGFIQSGLAIFENNSMDNDGVFLNGIALGIDVFFRHQWHTRVQLNFAGFDGYPYFQESNNNAIELWDAYIEYIGIPEINVRIGNMQVPYTIEKQYDPNQRISIWAEPFIEGWGHGRDPGIMISGLLDNIFEYKLSLHNGEGSAQINASDGLLMAASARIYPLEKDNNPDTFFHIGVIRSRDNGYNRGPGEAPFTPDPRQGVGRVNSAFLPTPWGRVSFANGVPDDPGPDDATIGWKTGVDIGGRLDVDLDSGKINHLRTESEFMFMRWERDFSLIDPSYNRLTFLQGFGFLVGLNYRHNFTPEIDNAGLSLLFKFSYSDVDNIGNDGAPGGNIRGQRLYVYTAGLGYAFNKCLSVQFNYIIVNEDVKDLYGGPKTKAGSTNPPGESGGLEHAWFWQFTAQW